MSILMKWVSTRFWFPNTLTLSTFILQAIDRLNLKTRNMKDLITDEHFSRSDLVTLQDPEHPEKWDISTFYHVNNKSDGNDSH